MPDVLDGIEFRASGRQRQEAYVFGQLELIGGVPSGLVEQDDGMRAGGGHAGDLSRFTIAAKLSGKTAQETATAIMAILERLDPCFRRSSTFDEWTEVLGSERLTGALLDRLTHHVHILEMNGESYRLRQSQTKKKS